MTKRSMLWIVPITTWLLFTFWYTDFGGPLRDDEIAEAMAFFDSRGIDSERRAELKAFFDNDTGNQFLMVNNIDMNDNPPPMEGFGPDATAADYNNHYMEHMYPALFSRACHPIFYASGVGFDADISGIEGAEHWELAALFRYRSRRSFMEIVTNPNMGPRHAFKLAAMTKTIAYPVETGFYPSDPRFLLFFILGFFTALIDVLVFGRKRH